MYNREPIEFIRKKADDDLIPISKPTLDTNNGWLSPDGNLYPCDKFQHNNLQGSLERNFGIPNLEKNWIKLLKFDLQSPMFLECYDKPTQAQINTMFDFCEKHKIQFPDWIDEKITILNIPTRKGNFY